MMKLSRNKMMQELQNKFELPVVPSEEFGNNYKGGIWVRGSVSNEKTNWYNADDTLYPEVAFNQFLSKRGWFAEPYDSETIFFYKV